MGVAKVVYNNNVLIDLSGDTVTAATLAEGVTAHNAAGEAIVGSAQTDMQSKTATLTSAGSSVLPDDGYAGLSDVTVPGVNTVLESKSVTPSESVQTVTATTAGKLGLSSVQVAAAPRQQKSITPSTTQQIVEPDSGKYGLSKVTVMAIPYSETSLTSGGTEVKIAST